MNKPPAVCRRIRGMLLAPEPFPGGTIRVQEHVETCPSCRAYQQRLQKMDRALSAPAGTDAAPPFLRERILNELQNEETPAYEPGWGMRWTWAAAAVVLALGIGLWVLPGRFRPEPVASGSPTELVTMTTRMAPEAAHLAGGVPTSVSQPLQREAALLAQDLGSAASFLLACWDGSASVMSPTEL